MKYVPAESVAFYALVDKLISSNFGLATGTPPTSTATMLSWGVFLLGLIGTPIYFWRQRTPGKPWQLHAVLATIAFVLWAYTLSGSFFLINGWYSVFAAALLAPIFTFVAGFFEQK